MSRVHAVIIVAPVCQKIFINPATCERGRRWELLSYTLHEGRMDGGGCAGIVKNLSQANDRTTLHPTNILGTHILLQSAESNIDSVVYQPYLHQ